MSQRQPYTYVLLRYRHDPLAGEFANVGVLLHAPRAPFLGARMRATAGSRIGRMFPTISRPAFSAAMGSIERSIDTLGKGDGGDLLSGLGDAGAFARRALPTDDSSFVWGPVGSGLTADPAQALARLYERFVAQYDEPDAEAATDDAAVWRPVHDLLIARNIAGRLRPKAIHSPLMDMEFDHAWQNGAWHVYQPLSFDLASEDHVRDKAAKWAGHMLALRDAEEPFKPHFIVAAPRDRRWMNGYQRALDVLRRPLPRAEVIDVSDAEALVDRIEAELRARDNAVAD
jgi:hypothetical protein